MNLKNQPPIFVPDQFRAEIEGLSKTALMDIAWNLARRCTYRQDHTKVIDTFRTEAAVTMGYRKSAEDAA